MAIRQGTTSAQVRGQFLLSWKTWVLWVGIALYAAYFGWLSDIKASNFDAHNHDLSHMWQSVWNVGHGHGFTFSLTGDAVNVPRLAVHADYLLILLAPLSWIWPHYTGLLFLQAATVALGAWLVVRIAERWTGSRGVSYALGFAYLLYGPLQLAVLWQFHAVTLAITFVLAAVEGLVYHRRGWIVWFWFGLALLTKEQVGAIVGPLLWVVAHWSDRRRLGRWLGGVGVTYAALHFAVIIPAMRDSGNSHFVWEFYYGRLGSTLPEQVQNLLRPGELANRLLVINHLKNAAWLLIPLAALPVLTPLSVLAFAAILPHWLSDNASQQSLLRVNHLLAMTVLVVAAIRASQAILRRHWLSSRWLGGLIFGAAAVGSIVISPLPWSAYVDPAIRQVDPQVATMRRVHRLIPSSAVVGYSRGAGAEWRDREFAWLLPNAIERLDYAVVFTSRRGATIPEWRARDDQLNDFFRSTPAWEAVYTQDRLSIYRRNPAIPLPPGPLPVAEPVTP